MMAPPKILLVDDDPAVRSSLKFSLELEGFDVETFESAEQLAEQGGFASAECLIVDYRLPGMDGLALLSLLRARGISLPAVMITSNPTRSIRKRVDEAGVSLIEKPLLSDALSTVIRLLTNRPIDVLGM